MSSGSIRTYPDQQNVTSAVVFHVLILVLSSPRLRFIVSGSIVVVGIISFLSSRSSSVMKTKSLQIAVI
jgi:hypothetical protein